MDNITALAILVAICMGLIGWCLITVVAQGNKLSQLETRIEDGNRRFDEIINRLDKLTNLFNEFFMHRRSNDKQ